jgi:protocatechuate 3,4-dioxygenase beta subunit
MTSLFIAFLFAVLAQAPLPLAVGNATIRGHVVRTDGAALARADVRLGSIDKPGPPRATTTDENGNYEFTQLPAGRYIVFASKTGFVAREFGQTSTADSGRPIVLAARETRERVDIALPRHGAIAGRVIDENAEPIEGISVSVRELQSFGSRRQLASVAGVPARRTNELGRFRVYGLQPGDYVIQADVGQGGSDDLPGYPVTYFPGTLNPMEAQRIHVGVADEVLNVEFALSAVRTARITGRTLTASGEPTQAAVQMRPSWRSTGGLAEAFGARVESDGRFEFANVAPGEYVIQAFKGAEMGWQMVTVTAADVAEVAVTTLPGSTIKGRVTFDGAEAPQPRDVEIVPLPADPDQTPFFGTPSAADIHDDWTFEIDGAIGPGRLTVTRAPAGFVMKRVIVSGLDATDAVMPLGVESQSVSDVEIVMAHEEIRLTGSLTGANGAPASNAAAIVFADDRQRWYLGSRFLRIARPARDGSFTVTGLPAGRYFVAAVDRMPDGDLWQDPAFLGMLAANAMRVTLTDGRPAQIALQLPPR